MIKADELKGLKDLETEILRRFINGYSHVKVPYLFENYTFDEIDFIKQTLSDHGYSINELVLYADGKQVGFMLDIFW